LSPQPRPGHEAIVEAPFHVGKEMNVLVGRGLGGNSLINANVALKAGSRLFEGPIAIA